MWTSIEVPAVARSVGLQGSGLKKVGGRLRLQQCILPATNAVMNLACGFVEQASIPRKRCV